MEQFQAVAVLRVPVMDAVLESGFLMTPGCERSGVLTAGGYGERSGFFDVH